MEFIAGSTDLHATADALNELLQMGSFDSIEALKSAFKSRVREEVASLVEQMAAADAFDLIELMRLREVPISPVLGLDPSFEGSGAALEVVALVLICRTSRLATDPDRVDAPNPHELVPALHDAAMRLLRLTTFYVLASARFSDEPLAALAAEYQANVVNVRTMQYPHLQDQQNAALLDSDRLRGSASTYGRPHPGHGVPARYCSNVSGATSHRMESLRRCRSCCRRVSFAFTSNGLARSPRRS
jgi:hypothetical protein